MISHTEICLWPVSLRILRTGLSFEVRTSKSRVSVPGHVWLPSLHPVFPKQDVSPDRGERGRDLTEEREMWGGGIVGITHNRRGQTSVYSIRSGRWSWRFTDGPNWSDCTLDPMGPFLLRGLWNFVHVLRLNNNKVNLDKNFKCQIIIFVKWRRLKYRFRKKSKSGNTPFDHWFFLSEECFTEKKKKKLLWSSKLWKRCGQSGKSDGFIGKGEDSGRQT